MFQKLFRSALAVTLVASAAFAQSRTLTVPVTSNDPAVQTMVAQVNMQNLINNETFVYFVAQASGYNFGLGGFAYLDSLGYDKVDYSWGNWYFCVEAVGYPWGAVAGGLGNASNVKFTLSY